MKRMLKIFATNWIHIVGLVLTMMGVCLIQYGVEDIWGTTLYVSVVAGSILLTILGGLVMMDLILFLKPDNQVRKKLVLQSFIVFGSILMAFRGVNLGPENIVRGIVSFATFITFFSVCQSYKSWRIRKLENRGTPDWYGEFGRVPGTHD